MSFFKKLFSKSTPEKSTPAEPLVEPRTASPASGKPPLVARRKPLPLGTKPKADTPIPTRQDPQELSINSLLDASELPETPEAPARADALPPLEEQAPFIPPTATEALAATPAREVEAPVLPAATLPPKEAFAFTAKHKAIKEAKELLKLEEETTPIQAEILIRRWHKRYNWLQDNGSEEQQKIAKQKLNAIALVKASLLND